jgi:DNA-binding MarR family transcriptional regulator
MRCNQTYTEAIVSRAPFDFQQAPGFLIRRAHQVSVACFSQATGGEGVTPVQFALLNALAGAPWVDQATLAARVALDAATSGAVINRMEARGWVERKPDEADRRRKRLLITPTGLAVARRMARGVAVAQTHMMQGLAPQEVDQLKALLRKMVRAHEDAGQAPSHPVSASPEEP